MTYDDVRAKTLYYGYNGDYFDTGGAAVTSVDAASEATIDQWLSYLYSHSYHASNAMEISNSIDFTLGDSTGVDRLVSGSAPPWIEVNMTLIKSEYAFTDDGRWFKLDPMISLAHELGHLVFNTTDPEGIMGSGRPSESQLNSADYQYGSTSVDFENMVASDLGISDQRGSYLAALAGPTASSAFTLGYSYTGGTHVDIVRLGDSGDNDIDFSHRTDGATTLSFGMGGADQMSGGSSADYMYLGTDGGLIHGNGGNDYLFGSSGSDVIHGDDGNDVISGGAGANTLFGDAGDDIIWDAGDGSSISGGTGDDLIIMKGNNTTATGGAGADIFRIETIGASDPASLEFTITDPDSSDQLIWNGYVIKGGPATLIDYEHLQNANGQDQYYYSTGAVDSIGTVYFRDVNDPSELDIGFADGSWLTVTNYTDGGLGINAPATVQYLLDANGNSYAPPGYQPTNIVSDGIPFDFENLSGAAQARENYGPVALADHWYLA